MYYCDYTINCYFVDGTKINPKKSFRFSPDDDFKIVYIIEKSPPFGHVGAKMHFFGIQIGIFLSKYTAIDLYYD